MVRRSDHKCICSVSELVRKLCMSRTRFYQLLNKGVFPRPVRCPATGRPFYPLNLQNECLQIRKTGIGHNSQPVIFYARRKDNAAKDPKWSNDEFERLCQELTGILKQMGLSVTHNQVRKAIRVLHPKGLEQYAIDGTLIRGLFSYFEGGL